MQSFYCDFAYMRLKNLLFSGTYPLIYSDHWSFYMRIHYMRAYFWSPYLSHIIQSNLCTTTTLGTLNLWPLLTGGRCSEVYLYVIKPKIGTQNGVLL